jgi:hypothetical protein
MTWKEKSLDLISRIVLSMPNAGLNDVIKAVDAAYPFGERKYYPYKAWLQAKREILGLQKKKYNGPILSPLDKAKAKYEAKN